MSDCSEAPSLAGVSRICRTPATPGGIFAAASTAQGGRRGGGGSQGSLDPDARFHEHDMSFRQPQSDDHPTAREFRRKPLKSLILRPEFWQSRPPPRFSPLPDAPRAFDRGMRAKAVPQPTICPRNLP